MPAKGENNNYVTSVGFQSDATGWGSIAIGSNASAANSIVNRELTDADYTIQSNTSNNKYDDVYEINKKPTITGASVALGYSATAKDGNIAIGAYSDASDTTSSTSYVSVGNSKLQRRITNVADGTAATDVATVGQLQALEKKTVAYNEGWGIKIGDYTKRDAAGNETTVKNAISVDRNLGNNSTSVTEVSNTGLILGGDFSGTDQPDENYGNYGATGQYAVTLGGRSNRASGESSVAAGGMDNTADGNRAFVGGGYQNTASGDRSSAIGGDWNTASGPLSSAIGGCENTASGDESSAIGGLKNIASGWKSSAFGGFDNISLSIGSSTLGGMDSVVLGDHATGIAGGSTSSSADNSLAAGSESVVTVRNGTAIGYQATTNKDGTIAFGHDRGDVSGYTVTWQQRTDKDSSGNIVKNADGTTNDYTKAPKSVKATTYDSAAYNRLVKVADGIYDHDVVVMEQLKKASGVGNNIKVYKTDENGNVQFDENNKPIEDRSDAAKTKQKDSKDAWGKALGAGTFTTGTPDKATDASTSDQLVTGSTLYDYDKPTGSQNYVNVNNTTGQNLSALDAQVKANADELDKPNHNIKFYNVDDKILKYLPKVGTYSSNEANDGANGMGSMAAGVFTHSDGIASTVAGSYSGVVGTGLQGATALSYGTFNVNQNAAQAGTFSGVANSIVGQANVTTDSNAAIIYGAGNTVKNSYRDIDTKNASEIMAAAGSGDVTKLSEALKKAVPTSGGQVMVMGGGNSVDKAYMTQVTGVGNTVTGSGDKYDKDKSTQLNYVEGFYTTLENGKNDYIIGSHNTVTGTSTETNQSNIVFGDNHTLTNTKNNIILGSLDAASEATVSDVVSIGHNAKVSAEGGVAIGSDSEATVAGKTVTGYDPTTGAASTNKASATWQATNGAVSIGTADGKVTRQINGVAAGTNETDAVNVAQLKTAQTGLTNKGLTFAGDDGSHTAKLGDTVKIYGSTQNKDHEYTSDNLTTKVDKDGNIQILMDKDMSADKIVVGQEGKEGKQGHIGLAGADGTNGKDGTNAVDITVKNGYDDTAKGINGTNGVDGKNGISRIVYEDGTGEHQVATLEDGLKFKGDNDTVIAKKLNNTMEIIGGADSKNLTEGNIGVNSTDKGQLKVQLAKDLTGITSISNQKTEGDKTTGAKITLGADGNVDVNGGKITHVGNGIETDGNGKYTVTDQNKGNAANIGDVQNIVNDAKTELTEGTNGLNNKANIDASNIGKNNAEKWGSAIGTGEIKADDGRMVTGKTVYGEVRPKDDGNYVKKDKTTGENLSALDSKIGKLDETKTYNYIDSDKDVSISDNLTKLDTQVKNNADAIQRNSESIQNITNNVQNLSDNAVQYDKDSNKSKVTLAGKDGTTITNVKNGSVVKDSKDAVNGGQLYEVNEKVTNNTNEITKIENGEGFTDAGKTFIKKLSTDAVQVKAGNRIKVDEATDEKTGNKTYTISANNDGKVARDDGNLISGDTLYKEVHVDTDGSYIKESNKVGQNLSALDTGLKTTSDLIHTNAKGDTIQIGSDSKATKIDFSGKDAKGNTTGRVITGVVSDVNDPNSAANVGYVNGITAASNQQIYNDMNMQYNHVENDISRAAAGSNALAALHPMQEFDPDDKAQFALGYGHYRNSNAGAVGAFYQPDENSMVNFGVSFGNGDAGINAGVTFKFGPGGSGHHALTKTQMAKVIDAQSKEIDELKKDNADKDKRIDALEQKMTEILAKLDKSKD